MKTLLSVLFIILMAKVAMASGGEHGADANEIPWETLKKQVFNFLLVFGGLGYLLRTKVKEFFSGRVHSFEKLLILAKKAREDAEKQKTEVTLRMQQLESTATDSVGRARKEAEELRTKLQAEAEALAKQIREEAAKTVERELLKAKNELKEDLLAQAMLASKELMKTSVKETDQKRLQNEFVQKIQVSR